VQSLSGTGALKLGAAFMRISMKGKKLYIPDYTWAIHKSICDDSHIEWAEYPYYDKVTNSLRFDSLIEFLNNVAGESVFLFHAIAHNPTGVDPSKDQWKRILQVVKDKKHVVFFDNAYQGFASGDNDNDRFAIQLWADEGLEMMIAQSFSKNFGLYNERVGGFHLVTNRHVDNPIENRKNAADCLNRIIRAMYSSPPAHGALIVQTIMENPNLVKQWKQDLQTMAKRLEWCRHALYDELVRLKTPGNWKFIIQQIGMFTYTGLSEAQVAEMVNKYHIYLLANGRISLAGINTNNVKYVASCIDAVVTGKAKL